MKRIIIILLAVLLSSCKVDTDKIIDSNENIEVSIHENGLPVQTYTLNPGDEEYKKFMSWVKSNNTGWDSTLASYVPMLIVSGESFSFNFMGNGVVVNYEGGQFTKSVDPKEYKYLKR